MPQSQPEVQAIKEELERLLVEASKLPWNHYRQGESIEVRSVWEKTPIVAWLGFDDSNRDTEQHSANAALIAAAVNILPSLLAELSQQSAMSG